MAHNELLGLAAFLLVFAATCAVSYGLFLWRHRDNRRGVARLRDLSAEQRDGGRPASASWSMLPRLGGLMLADEHGSANLRTRLAHAGINGRNGVRVFMGAKLLLMLVFTALAAVAPFVSGTLSFSTAVLICVAASAAGMFGPNLWLRYRIEHRQRLLRRGIADALDMFVLCLEGGVSLNAAIARVAEELHAVHPLMGDELRVIERSIQLGLSAGEAFREFGERSGLQDVRDLAAVILQSERFGASLVKTLQTHADWFRMERQQRAEERAQQCAVKILFPTLLCIFPAIFVVLLGPAMFQISALFSR